MALTEKDVLRIIYPEPVGLRGRRFTQDTPILPDVWIKFGAEPTKYHELLLTPNKQNSVRDLVQAVRHQFKKENASKEARVAYNDSYVLVTVNYKLLIRAILPLSAWWRRDIGWKNKIDASLLDGLLRRTGQGRDYIALLMEPGTQDRKKSFFTENVLNLVRIVGAIAVGEPLPDDRTTLGGVLKKAIAMVKELVDGIDISDLTNQVPPLWNVFTNRRASTALMRSRLAVKADAVWSLFKVSCQNLRWAVIDSGIDAEHIAFRKHEAPPKGRRREFGHRTRVVKTYDFNRLKELIHNNFRPQSNDHSVFSRLSEDQRRNISRDIKARLIKGQPLDWPLMEPFLEIPHDRGYLRPKSEHGTHVAGILAADWKEGKNGEAIIGMCPDIELYDLRVMDEDGFGDEFCILAALQFVRYLNSNKDKMVLHGVNLSLSIPHKVQSFACGSTPVCEECNRLVSNGVVAVVSAGNSGYGGDGINTAVDYRDISITDPGNAADVITVGATHRQMPHKYGVSYFSSRGPTGDGRMKPDLVAPGEQICSTIPGDQTVVLDGTSMAAPHVSGAAALLMARHEELIGDPYRIKEILCRTATDLGRERRFQGFGMLDVLRAIQSI